MNKLKLKKYDKIALGICVLCLFVIAVSSTYAYFSTNVSGNPKQVNVTAVLKELTYTDNVTISAVDIEPGWGVGTPVTKTFTIENTGNIDTSYNFIISNLVNTFVTEGYLQYKVVCTNGCDSIYGFTMSDFEDIPKSPVAVDYGLVNDVRIKSGTTYKQFYTIYLRYLEDANFDQSDDQGKIASGTFSISNNIRSNSITSGMVETLLSDNTIKVRNSGSYNNTFVENTTGNIYRTYADENGDGTKSPIYFYAGNTTNNWVKFGQNALGEDIYWRIIRSNENGGLRLLYTGTLPSGTALNSGTATSAAYISLGVFNSNYSDPKYVGYKYQTTTENDTNSTIKNTIDTWYKNNLLTLYGSYLDKQAIYCNDRSESTLDIEASNTYFGATSRLGGYNWAIEEWVRPSVVSPSYGCANLADRFSASSTGGGNGQLLNIDSNKSPIALMSADEISYAGGKTGISLSNPYAWYYLNNINTSSVPNKWWWTMSSFAYRTSDSYARVFYIAGSTYPGYSSCDRVVVNHGTRPVISLKPCLTITGEGTIASPYVVSTITSTCTSLNE